MSDKTYARGQSRKEWLCERERDLLELGCLQRIADATELMAKNHAQLVRDRDYYEQRLESEEQVNATLRRSNAALRGIVKKLKKGR